MSNDLVMDIIASEIKKSAAKIIELHLLKSRYLAEQDPSTEHAQQLSQVKSVANALLARLSGLGQAIDVPEHLSVYTEAHIEADLL